MTRPMNNSGFGCLLFVLAVLACVAYWAFVRIVGPATG